MEEKAYTTHIPMADARDMFAVHGMFRREFGLMEHLVREVASKDWGRVARVADHVALVTGVLHLHHTGEDNHIWPLLRERGDERIVPIVNVMEEQHGTIAMELVHLTEMMELWRKIATPEARDEVANAVARLVPAVDEHLSAEERHVVPLIEEYVSEEEYGVLAGETAAALPPNKLATVFGMVMYDTPPAVVDTIVARMPEAVRPVIRDAATRAYAAYAQELYGTPSPPRIDS